MITAIGDVMREAYKRGWITTRDGNISVVQSGNFYITPSGVIKHHIYPDNIIKIVMGAQFLGDADASIEAEMHWKLQNSTKLQSVVHLHPTNTIALMSKTDPVYGQMMEEVLMNAADNYPELRRYTKVGLVAPFSEPGTKELADSVFEAFAPDGEILYDIVGLHRHGVVAIGKSPWDAFEHIERLEHIAEICLKSGEFG